MNHKEHEGHKDREVSQTHAPIPAETEAIAREVIGAAIAVHKELGPGFLEGVYHRALQVELRIRQIDAELEKRVIVFYRKERLFEHRLDLVAGGQVVVEIKAVRRIRPIHQAQILSYLKASGCRVGLLINFNVTLLMNGLQRFVK